MKRDDYRPHLYVFPTVLGVWLILAAGVMTWLDPDMALLGWALLALTTVLAGVELFPYAGWMAAGAGSVLYAGLQVTLWGPTSSALVNAGAGATGLVGAAFLSSTTARQLAAMIGQLERNRRLINELTVHDPSTGLVKWRYACQVLKSEVSRSRRYHSDLSLLLMRPANWDELVEEHGPAGAEALMAEASRIVANTLRIVDTPARFDSVTLGALLPETSSEGARVAAQRLIDAVARKVRIALRVGIAAFPDDAVTDEALIAAAEAALQLALTSGRSIVCSDQLREALEAQVGGTAEEALTIPEHGLTELPQQERTALAAVHPAVSVAPEGVPAVAHEDGREGPEADQGVRETRVRILGLRQIARLHDIEAVLRAQPAIEDVTPLEYSDGALTMYVRYQSGPLTEILMELPEFPVREVRSNNGCLDVYLEDAGVGVPATA